MSHLRGSHVSLKGGSCLTYEANVSHLETSRVALMNESFHTHNPAMPTS